MTDTFPRIRLDSTARECVRNTTLLSLCHRWDWYSHQIFSRRQFPPLSLAPVTVFLLWTVSYLCPLSSNLSCDTDRLAHQHALKFLFFCFLFTWFVSILKKFGAPSTRVQNLLLLQPKRYSQQIALFVGGVPPNPPMGERRKWRFAGLLAFSFASFLLGVDKRKEGNLRLATRLTRILTSNLATNVLLLF